ncbi:hypothetical protein D3C76_1647130 [compost metagenome]
MRVSTLSSAGLRISRLAAISSGRCRPSMKDAWVRARKASTLARGWIREEVTGVLLGGETGSLAGLAWGPSL